MLTNLASVALVALAAFLGASSAHPIEHGPALHGRDTSAEEPCKQLRDAAAAWLKDNPVAPKNLTEGEALLLPQVPAVPVRPSLAFDCLKSVPLDKERALAHITSLRPIWEWQSTLDYNKNPPPGYLSEAVDVFKGLDDIAGKLQSNPPGYANEFQFLTDLQVLQGRVRDAHFGSRSLLFDLWTTRWGKQFVSVSKDGLALPQIFLHDDLKHLEQGYEPSPVTTIDGTPALDTLRKVAHQNWGYHDPDARFNSLFPSVSKSASMSNTGPEIVFTFGLNDTTTVTFQNGSALTFDNVALIRATLTNITSGADLYRDFGVYGGQGPLPTPIGMYRMAENRFKADFSQGFPKPFAASLGGDISGFLSDSPSLTDTVVLAISSFKAALFNIDDISDSSYMADTYKVPIALITAAKAAERTKLIIDLQGNSGGSMGYLAAIYSILFPGSTGLPFQSQTRVHPQLEWLLTAPRNTTSKDLAWSFGPYRQLNGTRFPNAEAFLGPVTTPFGNITRPAKTDPQLLREYSFTLPWTAPPFAPENITILTDGECASACALFTAILTHTHSIRTVTFGGRPLLAPMQAIGRTKGGPVSDLSGFPPALDRSTLPPGIPTIPTAPLPLRLTGGARPGRWAESFRFNLANMAPLGDGERAVPLQFRYEAAGGRVFWTWEMVRGVEKVWERVAEVAWGEGRCVEGSSAGEGGRMGRGGEVVGYEKGRGLEDEVKVEGGGY